MAKAIDISTALVGFSVTLISIGMFSIPVFYVGVFMAVIAVLFMLIVSPSKQIQLIPKKKPKELTIADSDKIAELERSLGMTSLQDTIKSINSNYPDLPEGYRWDFKYNPERKDRNGDVTYWEDYQVIAWYGNTQIFDVMVEPRKHSDAESMSAALDKGIAKCYKKVLEHYSERDMRQTIMQQYKIGG